MIIHNSARSPTQPIERLVALEYYYTYSAGKVCVVNFKSFFDASSHSGQTELYIAPIALGEPKSHFKFHLIWGNSDELVITLAIHLLFIELILFIHFLLAVQAIPISGVNEFLLAS
jgi:hypothetical protein